jgi:transcription antitermination factor NusG
MELSATNLVPAIEGFTGLPALPSEYLPSCWYAAYTCAQHEKRVAEQLARCEIEHFLPVYESVRRWKDRKKRLKLPLFASYLFVRISMRDRSKVVQIPGLVRLVGFGGEPVAVPEEDIAAIRLCLKGKYRIEPHPFLQTGQHVQIIRGALEGLQGILLRRKGTSRLVLSLGLIMRSVAVEVDASDVEPLPSGQKCQNRQTTA